MYISERDTHKAINDAESANDNTSTHNLHHGRVTLCSVYVATRRQTYNGQRYSRVGDINDTQIHANQDGNIEYNMRDNESRGLCCLCRSLPTKTTSQRKVFGLTTKTGISKYSE